MDLLKASNVRLDHLHQDGERSKNRDDRSHASERIVNHVWNKIKEIDSGYSDLSCELSVDSNSRNRYARTPSNLEIRCGR